MQVIVEKKELKLSQPFVTEKGDVIKNPVVAYEEYGVPDGPVICLSHGGLSSMHAAGRYSAEDPLPGWWDGVIGPGKAIDTERFRVISANSLGSMYGTTGPNTIDPDTGKQYGPDFPEISFVDMARYYKAFLDELKIKKVFLMAGPSMGSCLTLQLAALYPDLIGAAVPVATAGRMTPYGMGIHHFIINTLKTDPEFKDGWYELGKPTFGLKIVQTATRLLFTHERLIRKTQADPVGHGPGAQLKKSERCYHYMTDGLDAACQGRDPNSYITVTSALNGYDLGRDTPTYEEGVRKIKCPLLLINVNTDGEFPPHFAQEVADILNAQRPGQARVAIIDSDWGHYGCVQELEAINKLIAGFISELG